MKKVLSILLLMTIVISSCSISNNVTNNRHIQKRKYNKGFYFNFRNFQKDQVTLDQSLREDNQSKFYHNETYTGNSKRSVTELPPINLSESTLVNDDLYEEAHHTYQFSQSKENLDEIKQITEPTSFNLKNTIPDNNPKYLKRKLIPDDAIRKKRQLNMIMPIIALVIIIGALVLYLLGADLMLFFIPLLLFISAAIVYLALLTKYSKAAVAHSDIKQQKKVKRNIKLIWLTIAFAALLFGFTFLSIILFGFVGLVGIVGVIGFVATIVGYIFLLRKIKGNNSIQTENN